MAKPYRIHPDTVDAWKQTSLEKRPEMFTQDSLAEYESQIAEVEWLIGKKEVEIATATSFDRLRVTLIYIPRARGEKEERM